MRPFTRRHFEAVGSVVVSCFFIYMSIYGFSLEPLQSLSSRLYDLAPQSNPTPTTTPVVFTPYVLPVTHAMLDPVNRLSQFNKPLSPGLVSQVTLPPASTANLFRFGTLTQFLQGSIAAQSTVRAAVTAARAPVSQQEEIQNAVVFIEVTGVFADPKNGKNASSYSGSGFIIDPSGLIVTNNHVVTGAALIKVHLPGVAKPLNAKVLGVSECADLAVLDIEGSDYPYLEWYEQPIKVGMKIYAAGYPLGDPEFTLTSGIIAKAKANGNTSWSSIEYALQHEARILPGNSGGPLVTESGQVVGINYAMDAEHDQFFALPATLAKPIVQQLSTGENLDTLGLNGQAFSNGQGVSGIWIFSVRTGSPAGKAGIQAGDILLGIESLLLSQDGTMRTYCEILRSHQASEILGVQVARKNQAGGFELWEGEINGSALTFSRLIDLGSKPRSPIDEFKTWTDSKNIVSVDTPVDWQETKVINWEYNQQNIGIFLMASPNLAGFYGAGAWSAPGVAVGVSSLLGDWPHEDVLSRFAEQDNSCTRRGPFGYNDTAFQGIYYLWEKCNNDPNTVLVIVSMSPKQYASIKVLVTIQLTQGADDALVNRMIKSVVVHQAPPVSRIWAKVRVAGLNLRSGAGTNYPVVANLSNDEELLVIGQVNNCAWIHVRANGGQAGWVSGAAKFVALSTACAAIPAE